MSNASAASPAVHGYHAHVYYNTETFPIAEKLRETLAAKFPVELGRFSGEQVGPHPLPQFQIIFGTAQFDTMQRRRYRAELLPTA
jgi:aromatic ring-cleaving dioxygenase